MKKVWIIVKIKPIVVKIKPIVIKRTTLSLGEKLKFQKYLEEKVQMLNFLKCIFSILLHTGCSKQY